MEEEEQSLVDDALEQRQLHRNCSESDINI